MFDSRYLHERPGYLFYQPLGAWGVPDLIAALREILPVCRERGATRLLVDLTHLENGPVELFDRFDFGETVAGFWDRAIRVGMIGRPDQIDYERFGVLVARNRGLVTAIFETEAEALAWLTSPTPKEQT